jgi:pimeloyl-ACP methyl ester carboxylesterase
VPAIHCDSENATFGMFGGFPLGYAQRALQDVLRQVCRFYGHSWGGILAIEYALNHQQHLRGLVISDMTAGTQSYLKRIAPRNLCARIVVAVCD